MPPAAEGKLDLGPDGGGIYVDDPGLQFTLGTGGQVHVAAVDGGGEAKGDVVDDGDSLVEGGAGDDTDHRPEDLLPGDAHLRRDRVEDGRLDEVAMGQVPLGNPATADE